LQKKLTTRKRESHIYAPVEPVTILKPRWNKSINTETREQRIRKEYHVEREKKVEKCDYVHGWDSWSKEYLSRPCAPKEHVSESRNSTYVLRE
jgi:hypothetical protein